MGASKVWFYRHYGEGGESKAKADLCQQELLLELYNAVAEALNGKISQNSGSAPLGDPKKYQVRIPGALEALAQRCGLPQEERLVVQPGFLTFNQLSKHV